MSAGVLFSPQRLRAIQLVDRIVMASLSRMRSGGGDVPTVYASGPKGCSEYPALQPVNL
jgi:hypothetical protein